MEYTKDLILNIRYDESTNTLHLKTAKWTSKLLKKLKEHKIIVTTFAIFLMFIAVDAVLLTNFINVLVKV